MTYESYADEVLIVTLIESCNDYLFYLALAGYKDPLQGDTLHIQQIIQILSIWGTSINNSVGVSDFFFFFFVSICLSLCQLVRVSVHLFTVNLKRLKTHNY